MVEWFLSRYLAKVLKFPARLPERFLAFFGVHRELINLASGKSSCWALWEAFFLDFWRASCWASWKVSSLAGLYTRLFTGLLRIFGRFLGHAGPTEGI